MTVRAASRYCLALLSGVLIMMAPGCAPRGGAGLSLDETSAREALTTFLETWKSGGTSASLKEKDPVIYGRDFDWEASTALVSYEIEPGAENEGASAEMVVNLTLRAADDTESTVRAKYTVTTEPEITVIRSDEDTELMN